MLAGPALAGLLIGHVGVQWAYVVDVAGLAPATATSARLPAHPPHGESEAPSIAGIGQGLRYALRRRDLLGT